MLRIRKNGQTTLEYAVVIIIVLAVFLTVGQYVKRGIQGRWKSTVDDLGDQYNPETASGSERHFLVSNTYTTIQAVNAEGGIWTTRTDFVNSVESREGSVFVPSE